MQYYPGLIYPVVCIVLHKHMHFYLEISTVHGPNASKICKYYAVVPVDLLRSPAKKQQQKNRNLLSGWYNIYFTFTSHLASRQKI